MSFEKLCSEVCEAIQAAPPPLHHDDAVTSLSLRVKGIPVTIARVPVMPDSVLLLTELGKMPADGELDASLALLDVNFMLRGKPSFCIGSNSEGTAILQASSAIAGISAGDAVGLVEAMAAFSLCWRADHFLGSTAAGAHAQAAVSH